MGHSQSPHMGACDGGRGPEDCLLQSGDDRSSVLIQRDRLLVGRHTGSLNPPKALPNDDRCPASEPAA